MLRRVYILGRERVIIPPLRPVAAVTLMVIIGYVFRRFVILLRARFRWIHLGIGLVARLHRTTDRETVIIPTFQILGRALGVFRNGQVIRPGRLIARATFIRVFSNLGLGSLTGRRFQPLSGIVPEQTGNVDSRPIHSHRFLANDPRLDGYLGGGPLIPGVGVSLRDEIGQLGRRSGRGETSFLRYSSGWRYPTVHH